jgi:hypothetical protein
MAKVTTSTTIGISDEEHEFDITYLLNTGNMHVDLTKGTTMVFFTPATMHNLADQLKAAAEEWDAKEFARADLSQVPFVIASKDEVQERPSERAMRESDEPAFTINHLMDQGY